MKTRTGTIFGIMLIVSGGIVRSDDPPRLLKTEPLVESGDLASKMIDGIDRFLLRKIAEAETKHASFWKRDLANGIDGHVSADEPNRKRLLKMLGMRAGRIPAAEIEILSTVTSGTVITEDDTVRVVAVRWEASQDIHAEGLLLIPIGSNKHVADVIVRILIVPRCPNHHLCCALAGTGVHIS